MQQSEAERKWQRGEGGMTNGTCVVASVTLIPFLPASSHPFTTEESSHSGGVLMSTETPACPKPTPPSTSKEVW